MKVVSKQAAEPALPVVSPHAAGLDIGLAESWVAVPAGSDPPVVRPSGTFTPDLHDLSEWLSACGLTTVAMESTVVSWIPIYELLQARGFQVYLINARHIKNVPGRKSDVKDCQWIQRLHNDELLSASYRPEAEMVVLRAYLRQCADLIQHCSAHIQHMQKALAQMNLQLTKLLKDITGVTGMQFIRAIVGGERNPVTLAQFRQPGCQHSTGEIAKALSGNYRPEHLFALKQALSLYDADNTQILECDQELERQFSALKPTREDELPPLDTSNKRDTHSKNGPKYNARSLLCEHLGVDLLALDGLNASSVQALLTGVGRSLEPFDGQALLLLAAFGAAQRHFGRQGLTQPHAQSTEPRRTGLPAGSAVGQPHGHGVRRLLPAHARQAPTKECDCGLGSGRCPDPKPLWQPPTRSHALSTVCSKTVNPIAATVPRSMKRRSANVKPLG